MILMNDFTKEPDELLGTQIGAVEQVLKSGWFVLGKEVEAFEKEWAHYCGAKFAIGVANGMDALEIGIRALGLSTRDEVITTPMTAFATTLAILRAGATPVLADIDPATGQLDPKSVERCLSPKTKAILPVHLYGTSAPIQELDQICKKRDILLIEDCCQAHGAKYNGRKVGTFGKFGAWSFYPTKNLGTPGDGGCLTTDDKALADQAIMLRNYGQSQRYYHPVLGLNSRLDEIHAAILRVKMTHLDEFNSARCRVAQTYDRLITNPKISLVPRTEGSVSHLYPILVENRVEFMNFMIQKSIQTLIHYPVPVHLQESCNNIATDPLGLKNAEWFANRVISIPCNPFMSEDEVARVIDAVNLFGMAGAE
jgi:dTDP-4-amino-4,6-dideoxygalactose transaminase